MGIGMAPTLRRRSQIPPARTMAGCVSCVVVRFATTRKVLARPIAAAWSRSRATVRSAFVSLGLESSRRMLAVGALRSALVRLILLTSAVGCDLIEGPDDVVPTQSAGAGGNGADVGLGTRGAGELIAALEYVRIPAGTFVMGSPADEEGRGSNESPQHEVSISTFELAKYEVTNAQYELFLKAHPSVARPPAWKDRLPDDEPAADMTWREATTFAHWVGGRLPTEAEWEYAARAGTTGARYAELDSVGWYDQNSGGSMHVVGEKQGNAWGLHDMLGNMYEWCADWYEPYSAESATDPAGPALGGRRVVRGGSFADADEFSRAAYRSVDDPGIRSGDYGFRVARDAR